MGALPALRQGRLRADGGNSDADAARSSRPRTTVSRRWQLFASRRSIGGPNRQGSLRLLAHEDLGHRLPADDSHIKQLPQTTNR